MTPLEQILADAGKTLEELRAEAEAIDRGPKVTEVSDSKELRRILGLPRRSIDDHDLAAQMTEAFARSGEMHLRPIQAHALADLYAYGGAFCPIRVGGGKTLISYLAPAIVKAYRPLLIIPAKLREKTKREFTELAKHWHGPDPDAYKIESYQRLGRVSAGAKLDDSGETIDPGFLERYRPDLIVLDEAHKVKNLRAAVTRRLARFMKANPGTRVMAMSGTITKRSIQDFAHVLHWCLPRMCPLPTTFRDLEEWHLAIDENVDSMRRIGPGHLEKFCDTEELREGLSGVRRAVRRRIVDTPGVIATQEGELGVSLSITSIHPPKFDPQIDEHFKTLRTLWETPDQHPIIDAITMWRHAREIALGFFYRWNPRPPEEWLVARKAWAQWCREVLRHNRRGLDSELQVIHAVDRGVYRDGGLLNAWREIKETFVPNTEAVWFSDEAIDAAVKWAQGSDGGIIWVEHLEFGKRLAARAGLPFYASEGKTEDGLVIEDAKGSDVIIASVLSNSEGRNLQRWNSNFVMSAPPNGSQWEQLLGRTHRDGQTAEEVSVDLYLSCLEHYDGFHRARSDGKYAEDLTGQAQRICYADVNVVISQDVPDALSWRWHKEE